MATKQFRLLAEIMKQFSDLVDMGCFQASLKYDINGATSKFIEIEVYEYGGKERIYYNYVDFKKYNYPSLCRKLVEVAEEIYSFGENYEE